MSGTLGHISESLVEYVEAAAYQRLRLLGRLSDRRLLRRGGAVIYSIDTDIVVLYLDPERRSANEPGRRGYAEIFPGDPEELSIALGRAISEFIFFELDKEERAFVLTLPPLEREVGDLFYRIANEVSLEHRDLKALDFAAAESAVKAIEGEKDERRQLEAAIDAIPQLRPFLFGYGPSMLLSRFSFLVQRSRLMALEQALLDTELLGEEVKRLLRRPELVSEALDVSVLTNEWRERIREEKSRTLPRNLEADSRVLARIEFLNRIGGEAVRVVHVTGDPAIHAAAKQYVMRGEEASFATKYLRDPRAFLAEPAVLFSGKAVARRGPDEFAEWLDVFLGRFTRTRDISRKALWTFLDQAPAERRRIVEDAVKRFPRAEEMFAERWRRFCGPVTLEHRVERSRAGSVRVRAQRQAEQRGESGPERLEALLTRIEVQVEKKIDQTWRDCFDAATATGFSLLHFGRRARRRGHRAPLIGFARFRTALEFFRDMLEERVAYDYRKELGKLGEGPPYQYYLAFGALFAASGKWHVAEILAAQALGTIGDEAQDADAGMGITGREAFYLRGIARRVTARDERNFEAAASDLRSARKAFDTDINRSMEKGENLTQLRFDLEELELDLSRYFLSWARGDDVSDWVVRRRDMRRKALELLVRVEEEGDGVYGYMRRPIRCSVMTDYFLSAMGVEEELIVVATEDDGRNVFGKLAKEMKEGGGSYLQEATWLVIRILYGSLEARRGAPQGRGSVDKHFRNERIREHSVTMYDGELLKWMYRTACGYLNNGVQEGV